MDAPDPERVHYEQSSLFEQGQLEVEVGLNIQLALDRLSMQQAVNIAEQASPYVDWIEVGTSLIKEFGMDSVKKLRAAFPGHLLVADMKTYDNAVYEFELCFAAGADAATVMGSAPPVSIEACMNVAAKRGKRVMIDLLNASEAQLDELKKYREAIFCLHISKDQQELGDGASGADTVFGLHVPRALADGGYTLAIAGGITAEALPKLAGIDPWVVIVGSSITKAENPAEAARKFRMHLNINGG